MTHIPLSITFLFSTRNATDGERKSAENLEKRRWSRGRRGWKRQERKWQFFMRFYWPWLLNFAELLPHSTPGWWFHSEQKILHKWDLVSSWKKRQSYCRLLKAIYRRQGADSWEFCRIEGWGALEVPPSKSLHSLKDHTNLGQVRTRDARWDASALPVESSKPTRNS